MNRGHIPLFEVQGRSLGYNHGSATSSRRTQHWVGGSTLSAYGPRVVQQSRTSGSLLKVVEISAAAKICFRKKSNATTC